jgi:adenylylsulfate kinase-like enzyme
MGSVSRLVVIVGPIGSGKSTVARLLAARLVASGRTVATPDVDDVGDPLRGLSQDPLFLRETHERFTDLRPSIAPCDHTFDTELMSAEHIADLLAAELVA